MKTLAQKKQFVAAVKDFAKNDLAWLVLSHNNPNGHETTWTRRVVGAAIARHS